MKKIILILFYFAPLALLAQITNGNINYEMRVEQWRQTCDNDGLSADDNEVRIGLNSDANSGGTATWTSGGSGASCGGNQYVQRWQADAASTTTFGVLMYNCTNRTNAVDYFNIQKTSWEEDGSPDCNQSGDACQSNDATNYTYKSGSKTPNRWWGYAGTADTYDGWSIGNSVLYMMSAWRYTNGSACGSSLSFGTIGAGATVSHVNSNRAAPSGAQADKGYTSVIGNGAPDVFYDFTITTPRLVTITSNFGFDGYLRLYDSSCGTQIDFNDDFGTTLVSQITRALCAGTYKIVVEGYSTNSGDFTLSVNTANLATLSGGTIGGITNGIGICDGDDPGAFTNSTDVSGGLTAQAYSYGSSTYQWQRATNAGFTAGLTTVGGNATTYDPGTLTAGTYYFRRVVTDACGTVAYSNVIQVVVNTYSVAPTSITGTTTICAGGSTTLSVSGGSLGSGGVWRWYSASCGGTLAGTGTSIIVSPASTTTYYVRAEGTCNTTTCASVAVTVNTLSVAPTSITGTTTICAGDYITLSVSGGSLGTGGVWRWYSASCGGTLLGSGTSIIVSPASTTTYYVRAEGTCNTTTCASVAVTVNTLSTTPTAITGTTTICAGGSTTLSVSGGSLGTGGVWRWYSASCGGTLVGSGTSIVVSPASNTTYFVRAEGTCNTTSCAGVTVTVNTLSTAPTSITGTTTICAGGSTTLSVSGGSLGTGGVWRWYTASCGGTLVSTGPTLVVSPASTTTYYVRAEGTCNTTTCASVAVTVYTLSTPPSSIAGVTTICAGGSTTLSVSGGSVGTGGAWNWYTASCGGTLVGTGTSLVVSPASTTTYYVRAESTCNTTICASRTVTVNTLSTAPTSITGTTTICAGGSTTLSVSGGSLGTGGVWNWYTASCGGTLVGTGTSLVVSPASTTTYYVRAEGTCNTTTCASVAVTVNTLSVAPTSIGNIGGTTICAGSNVTIGVIGGSLGTGGSWNWYTGSCGGTLIATGSSKIVTPLTTTTYYVRAEGTCNTTACISITITVNTPSVAPTSITGTSTICAGGSTTLSVSGGSLGTAGVWNWYTSSCGGTLVGTGSSLVVSPASTTTYYVRAEGTCNTTTCASVAVTVNTLSVAPTGATASSTFSCTGDAVDLSVTGGSLGTNASWKWYSDAGFTTLVGSGSPLTVYPTATTTYYVRAEGDCNTIGNQSVTVFVNGSSTAPSGSVALATTTSSSTCVVADNNWHYFYNSAGELLAAINSNNQNLGNVTVTITVGDSGPFGQGLAPGVCGYPGANGGEYVMPRYWDITVANQPSTPVDVIFYYKDSDITSLAATINAQNANYVACWGDVNVEADLMMTVAHTAGGTELFPSLAFAAGPNTGAGHRQIGFQLSEFSGGKLHSNNGLYAGNPLPVELVEFTAKTVNNQFIQLNWKTATEINNKGFEVQRSTDGIEFEKIGFITGNGNSNLINNYSFQDNNVAKGVYYYKLKQIDFDGEFEYSEIRNANILGDDKIEVSYFIPNPAENNTILNFVVNKDTEVSIAIYDGIGRKVIDRKEVLSSGKNSISFNTTDLAAGVYSTKILIDNEEFARKLVISK